MSITEVDSVKRYLNSVRIFVNHSWLEGCVKHISQYISKDFNQIVKKTAEQLILNDLKDVAIGCLPPNLKSHSKIVLADTYLLQIMSEIDIGVSSYQQYCKLTKVNNEDVEATISAEEKVHSHRMLKLSLTDGVQDILGVEYKSISKIKTSLIPGCKILIKDTYISSYERGNGNFVLRSRTKLPFLAFVGQKNSIHTSGGPVVCRSGILFLDSNSIEVMGGEVEGLSDVNVKTMILASKLGKHQVDPASNDQEIQHPEITEPVIDSNERLDSHQPPAKRQRTLSYETIGDVGLDVFTDQVKIVSSNPFIYIKQINDMSESVKMGKTCKVKAQILYLLKTPILTRDSWKVECKITDGTGCLNVQIDSDWFSNLVQYTPQKMADLKVKRISNPAEVPIIDRDLLKKLGKAMKKLKSLYCIMKLTILPTPIIKEFIPFEKQHVMLINKRLQGL